MDLIIDIGPVSSTISAAQKETKSLFVLRASEWIFLDILFVPFCRS